MTLFEKIEKEFANAFNDRVLETIKKQIPIYHKKHPFVGKITIGMGGAAVDDRDGVKTPRYLKNIRAFLNPYLLTSC